MIGPLGSSSCYSWAALSSNGLKTLYVTGTAEVTLEEIFPNSANRKPNEATELLQLRDEHPEVVVVKELDITEYDKGFKEFVQDIKVVSLSGP